MNNEDINDLYEQLLDEYKDYKEEMRTASKARSKFAMDVHEQMKQEQIEQILEELGDIFRKINDDSSEDKTNLRNRFHDLIEDFNEINEYSYGGKKNGKTKRTVRKTKRTMRKTKRTMRKTKRSAHKRKNASRA